MALTSKQENFAQSVANNDHEYLWEAYDAHYDTSNMSREAVYVEACRLRQNPKIALRISEIEKEIRDRSLATLDEVLAMMTKRMRVSLKDFFDSEGCIKSIQDLTDEQAMCIVDFKTNELGMLREVKLESIKSVWDMFMKKFGAYINVHVGVGKNVLSEEQQEIIDAIEE